MKAVFWELVVLIILIAAFANTRDSFSRTGGNNSTTAIKFFGSR